MIMEEEYYNSLCGNLLGRKIEKAYYQQVSHRNKPEYWRLSEFYHSVEMNVVLLLDNKELVQINWGSEYGTCAVEFERLNQLSDHESLSTMMVPAGEAWDELIQQKITEIKVHLLSGASGFLPHALELNFENDEAVWIAAMEIEENSAPYYAADHLTVLFHQEFADKYRLEEKSVVHSLK